VFVICCLAASLPGACGSETETEEDRVGAAIEDAHEALAEGRLTDVCAAMTERPKRQIGSVGHARTPTSCERDLRDFLKGLRDAAEASGEVNDLTRAPRPRVKAVRLGRDGKSATAILVVPGGTPYDVPLVKQDANWKLDDFFGASGPPPRAFQ
jgi:hypothetical protein